MSTECSVLLYDVVHSLRNFEDRWVPKDNLATLELSKDEFDRFATAAQRGLESFSSLSREDRQRWGACMLIAGAFAFNRAPGKPRVYETIGSAIGVTGLAEQMNNRREYLEEGAALLQIQLVRRDETRLFVETMVANSGIDVRILEEAAAWIRRHASWSHLAVGRQRDAEVLVEQFTKSAPLPPGLLAQLSTAEGQSGVADRLIALAKLRDDVRRGGLERSTVDEIRSSVTANGYSFKATIGCDASDRLIREVFGLSEAGTDAEISFPRLRWSTHEAAYGLVVEFPLRLDEATLVSLGHQVVLEAIDAGGRAVGAGVRYSRGAHSFERGRGTWLLRLDPNVRLPLSLTARSLDGGEERVLARLSLGVPPVALMNPGTGELVASANANTEVVLLIHSGWTLRVPLPEEWKQLGGMAAQAWRGVVPLAPLELVFDGPESETLPWTIGGAPRLRFELEGDRVDGLRYGSSPAFRSTPHLRVLGADGRVLVELEGPGGMLEPVRASLRGGVCLLPSLSAPGRYTVAVSDLRAQRKSSARSFVLLPQGVDFRIRELTPKDGEVACFAEVVGSLVQLSPTSAGATATAGGVQFSAETRGPQRLGVHGPAPLLDGVWTPRIEPHDARLIDFGEESIPTPWDLTACDPSARFEISGPADGTVRLTARDREMTRVLSPEGRRSVMVSQLFPKMECETSELMVSWATKSVSYEIANLRLARTKLERPRPSEVAVEVPRALRDPVELEALSVLAPWTERLRVAAKSEALANGKVRYLAPVPPPGLWFVGLSSRGRAVTGLALLTVEGPTEAPSRLAEALSKNPPVFATVCAEFEAMESARLRAIARNVNRHGPRFFKFAGALAQVAGRVLAEDLAADAERAGQGDVFGFLQQSGEGAFALRERDLVGICALLDGKDIQAEAVLRRLADWNVGLVHFMVSQLFRMRAPSGTFMQVVAGLMRRGNAVSPKGYDPISPEHLRTIETPFENAGAALAWDEKTPLRVAGLLQVRLELERHDGMERHRSLLKKLTLDAPTLISPNWQPPAQSAETRKALREVAPVEAVVFSVTKRVHEWRRRPPSGSGHERDTECCRQANLLASYFPALVEYWLTVWNKQSSP